MDGVRNDLITSGYKEKERKYEKHRELHKVALAIR